MTSEVLISLVENQPAVWDKGNETYRDKVEKEKAWIAIARGMYSDWDAFSSEVQQKKMAGLKNKWRNIKDSMMKYLQVKSGDSAKKKKYVHFEALTFLRTTAEKRRSSGNYDSDDSSQEEGIDQPSFIHEDPTTQLSTSPPPPTQSSAVASTPFERPTTQPAKMNPFQASLIMTLQAASESLAKSQATEDADRLYLLSLLPDYKNLNSSKKWEFRLLVADFFWAAYDPRSFNATPMQYQDQQVSMRYPVQGTSFSQSHMMQPHSSQSLPASPATHSPSPGHTSVSSLPASFVYPDII